MPAAYKPLYDAVFCSPQQIARTSYFWKLKTRVSTFICSKSSWNSCILLKPTTVLFFKFFNFFKFFKKFFKNPWKFLQVLQKPTTLLSSSLHLVHLLPNLTTVLLCSSITTHCTNFLLHLILSSSTNRCCFSFKNPRN